MATCATSALEACRHEWIFSLDSDERCTEEVRDEILALIDGAPAHDVYLVPRKSYMMGRWIKGSGWYPNFRQPQLFRKGAMRYTLEPVHEGYENLSGKPLGALKNAVWQYPFRNLEEVINKMNRYSSLGVPKLAGKRVSMAERARPRLVVVHQALHFQARLPRRLGRLRHRLRQFRGHILPLCQALRGDQELAGAGGEGDQARTPNFWPSRERSTIEVVEWPGTRSTRSTSPPSASTISWPTTCSRV